MPNVPGRSCNVGRLLMAGCLAKSHYFWLEFSYSTHWECPLVQARPNLENKQFHFATLDYGITYLYLFNLHQLLSHYLARSILDSTVSCDVAKWDSKSSLAHSFLDFAKRESLENNLGWSLSFNTETTIILAVIVMSIERYCRCFHLLLECLSERPRNSLTLLGKVWIQTLRYSPPKLMMHRLLFLAVFVLVWRKRKGLL